MVLLPSCPSCSPRPARPARRALSLLAAASLLAQTGEARANSAQTSWSTPENGLTGPVLSPTPVTVLRETLRIDCTRGEECLFEATYEIENPQGDSLEVVGAFFGYRPGQVAAELDRADVQADLSPEQEEMLRGRARAVAGPLPGGDDAPGLVMAGRGFRFRIEGHRHATVVFRGQLATVSQSLDRLNEGYGFSPPSTRHPLVFRSQQGLVKGYVYPISPIRTWGGEPLVEVEILAPDRELIEPGAGWEQLARVERRGNVRRVTATIESRRLAELAFVVRDPRRDAIVAGPLVGIGGRLDTRELRLRAGFEFTGPARWAMYSLNLDSNLKDYLVASAVVEAASPSLLGIGPSFAVGAGVPVRLEKGTATRVGIRAQIGLNFTVLGLVFPLDYYPAAGPAGDHLDLSLLARVSF